MNCTHVLGLIDAGPFADYPQAHLDAAWQHAGSCTSCGAALAAARTLTVDLSALPQPAPPRDFTADVLLRVAQRAAARPVSVEAPLPDTGAFSVGDWPAWANVFGALTAALPVVLLLATGSRPPIDIMTPKVGAVFASLVALPASPREGLALASGLVLYAAGLFASVGRGRRRFSSQAGG